MCSCDYVNLDDFQSGQKKEKLYYYAHTHKRTYRVTLSPQEIADWMGKRLIAETEWDLDGSTTKMRGFGFLFFIFKKHFED